MACSKPADERRSQRRAARKAERLALLAADSSIHANGRKDVQGAGCLPGDELGTQHGVSEPVLRTRVANIVLLIEEKVRVVVARVAFASRDSDGVKVDTIGLRSLQD